MPSETPKRNSDAALLRAGIIAELDAINLYEQLAEQAENEKNQKIVS